MDVVVVSLGGSVLLDETVDDSYLNKLSKMLVSLSKQYRLYIVVGGGKVARSYIARGRSLGFSEDQLDLLGIEVTRVNAKFLSMLISVDSCDIAKTIDDALVCSDDIVVMGGTYPGHSTDMVGAELAGGIGAVRFVIATNVNGVYDKDPNQYSDAQQLSHVHIDDLLEEHGDSWESAGKNTVIDGPALGLIKKNKIPTVVVNGLCLLEMQKAVLGKSFDGTVIAV